MADWPRPLMSVPDTFVEEPGLVEQGGRNQFLGTKPDVSGTKVAPSQLDPRNLGALGMPAGEPHPLAYWLNFLATGLGPEFGGREVGLLANVIETNHKRGLASAARVGYEQGGSIPLIRENRSYGGQLLQGLGILEPPEAREPTADERSLMNYGAQVKALEQQTQLLRDAKAAEAHAAKTGAFIKMVNDILEGPDALAPAQFYELYKQTGNELFLKYAEHPEIARQHMSAAEARAASDRRAQQEFGLSEGRFAREGEATQYMRQGQLRDRVANYLDKQLDVVEGEITRHRKILENDPANADSVQRERSLVLERGQLLKQRQLAFYTSDPQILLKLLEGGYTGKEGLVPPKAGAEQVGGILDPRLTPSDTKQSTHATGEPHPEPVNTPIPSNQPPKYRTKMKPTEAIPPREESNVPAGGSGLYQKLFEPPPSKAPPQHSAQNLPPGPMSEAPGLYTPFNATQYVNPKESELYKNFSETRMFPQGPSNLPPWTAKDAERLGLYIPPPQSSTQFINPREGDFYRTFSETSMFPQASNMPPLSPAEAARLGLTGAPMSHPILELLRKIQEEVNTPGYVPGSIRGQIRRSVSQAISGPKAQERIPTRPQKRTAPEEKTKRGKSPWRKGRKQIVT